jgi:hypothetical protein
VIPLPTTYSGSPMIHDGSEVAVLRHLSDRPSQVLELATVRHAGEVFIELVDGRKFATIGGIGLNTSGVIIYARDEHRVAIRKRMEVKVA